jgi:Polysaccharide pyruvyl transferase
LVAGWFSFAEMGATSGDLAARDLVCDWLETAGVEVDVANAEPFAGGVDWTQADPARYSHVVFVCGPAGNGWPLTELLERFRSCRLVGLNLSMLEALEVWNPFADLIERDSSRGANPDITFASISPAVPVVGVVLVHAQREYTNPRHVQAEAAVERLLAGRELAPVRIDTRLDVPGNPLRSPAAVESLVRRTDAVVTTRLHGLVTALKLGIPAVAIDPIAGGAKVARQAQTVGWPIAFTVDELDDRALAEALDFCLSPDGRALAAACAERARERVVELRADVVRAVLDSARD